MTDEDDRYRFQLPLHPGWTYNGKPAVAFLGDYRGHYSWVVLGDGSVTYLARPIEREQTAVPPGTTLIAEKGT